MPSPLEDRLFLLLKRLEATEARLAKSVEGITSGTDIPKIVRKIYNFTHLQAKRELAMTKRLEALEATVLKLLRSNAALADALKDTDLNHEKAIAKTFRYDRSA